MARKIEVEIVGDASSYQRALGQAQTKTSKFGKVAKTALVGGVAAGLYAVGKAAKIGWDEFNSGQKEAAQTAAVIKSTGGVANVTAEHVQGMGTELMKLSGIDDELIVNGENLLLTFRGIRNEAGKGNDMFDQATKVTLDLATAMGTDMHSAAIQVGKALNDPQKGFARLSRIGVDFTEKQEKMIVKLSEAGDKMGAQKVILKELTTEFGGSAKAAGETFGGQLNIARERLNNFLGDLVAKAIPYLQRLIAFIKENWPKVRQVFVNTLNTIRQAWDRWGEDIKRIVRFVFKVVVPIIRAQLHLVVEIFKTIGALLRGDWSDAWNHIKGIVKAALGVIKAILTGWITVAKTVATKIGGAIKDGIVAGAKGLASALSSLVKTAVNAVLGLWNNLGVPGFHVSLPGPVPDIDFGGVSLPDIPLLNDGGRIARTGMAVVHKGETVVPAGAGWGSGDIVVQVDGREILRAVRRSEGRESRR